MAVRVNKLKLKEKNTFTTTRSKQMKTAQIKKKARHDQRRCKKTQRKVKVKLLMRMSKRERKVTRIKRPLLESFYKSVSRLWFLLTMMAFYASGIYR